MNVTGCFRKVITLGGLGPPNVHFADFYDICQPVASTFINRSLLFRRRTIALAYGVNVRVVQFSLGVAFGG